MNLNQSTTSAQNFLYNIENYKNDIIDTYNEILTKYNLLIFGYLYFIIDNIHITNTVHAKFIILKGLYTITHVFNMILYYSKNIELAYYHGQRAFYFYVEFISQTIGNEQQPFLQLNSRDAIIFVYKKTIFEINNEYRKNGVNYSLDDTIKLDILNIQISIIKNIINKTIEHIIDFSKNIDKTIFKHFIKITEKICNKLNNIKFNNDTINYFNSINLFIENLNNTYSDLTINDNYYTSIDNFIKNKK